MCAHLLELRLGEAFLLMPQDATALAAACPRLRSASFRLAFDGPGIAALADGARLPRGCCVSLEAGAEWLCYVHRRHRRDRELRDAFSIALAAVGAAGGSLSAASTDSALNRRSNTTAGLLALATTSPAALASLKKLDLRNCTIPHDGERSTLAAVLGSCPQLQCFRSCWHNLSHVELRTLAALPALSFLDVSHKPRDGNTDYAAALRAGLEAAAHSGHTMRHLVLDASCCALHDVGVAELAAAISGGAGVRRLYVSGNHISDAGATALADALVVCGRAVQTRRASSLHVLGLTDNLLTAVGVTALAHALQAPGVRLRRLDLCRSGTCGDTGAVALAQALTAPGCPLEELRLRHCGVGTQGALALAAAIETAAASASAAGAAGAPRLPTMLKVLMLDGSACGDDGAVALARALSTPGCALELLSIRLCGVTQRGALALAAALRRNRTLKSLRLYSNPLTTRGMTALLAAIGAGGNTRRAGGVTNTTLEKLNLPKQMRREVSAQTRERLRGRVSFG